MILITRLSSAQTGLAPRLHTCSAFLSPNPIHSHKLLLVMEKYIFKAASEVGPPRQLIEFPAVL